MAENTSIEWTHLPGYKGATWNPLSGCSMVSPGCHSCYAATMAARLEAMGQKKYAGTTKKVGTRALWTGKVNLDEKSLAIPLKTKKPTAYFVNSMSDLFHEDVPDAFIDKVFAVMAMSRQHVFQVLTKRAKRMRDYLAMVSDEKDMNRWACAAVLPETGNSPCAAGIFDELDWPLRNVWLGVSVEDRQRADERIPLLLQTPAAVRFLSVEPLLGPVDIRLARPTDMERLAAAVAGRPLDHLTSSTPAIDWVIVGGESGPGARPMHPDWARSVRDQCQEASVPFFFKQHGSWVQVYDRDTDPDARNLPDMKDNRRRWLNLAGGHGFHGDRVIAVEEVNKKVAGRVLDGRTWDEFPEVQP
jgi:protein gp37